MSSKIDDLEKKIFELETRVTQLEKLESSSTSPKLSGFPKELISKLDKIPTKNLILLSLKINSPQSITNLKTNLSKIGWIEDTFFKKNFGTALGKKGLIRKIDDETIKDAYGLTARGIIIADELFSKLTKP